jgi:hypothetical protein
MMFPSHVHHVRKSFVVLSCCGYAQKRSQYVLLKLDCINEEYLILLNGEGKQLKFGAIAYDAWYHRCGVVKQRNDECWTITIGKLEASVDQINFRPLFKNPTEEKYISSAGVGRRKL